MAAVADTLRERAVGAEVARRDETPWPAILGRVEEAIRAAFGADGEGAGSRGPLPPLPEAGNTTMGPDDRKRRRSASRSSSVNTDSSWPKS